ncbi:glyoxylate reductase [Fusarium mexicanum]|uniref:Glyoxylate reductase n=1 Tax=Fusarium mexicanum TaxID=751941 RepID=A0A8H5MJZ6_9HYPO|nr:glyoxylate reductase [Fusarium mexicanum]
MNNGSFLSNQSKPSTPPPPPTTVTLLPTAPAQTQTTNTTRRPLRRPKYPSSPIPVFTLDDGTLMARPQNRKRQRDNELSQADIDPPAKRAKTKSEIERKAWESWEYPPEFYDRLSKVSLNRRALKELDRRPRTRRSHPSPPAIRPRDLARFARRGGPDLRDLRGYPHPPTDRPRPVAMNPSQSSRSRRTKSTNPTSILPTTTTTKTKKSAPHNRDFDLHLTEHGVHPIYSSQKPDLGEIRATLAVPRASLSPSQFSEGAFEAFQESNARAKDEDDVLATVIPTILGPSQASRNCARNTMFNNLDPLTDGTITAAQPDMYWGAYPAQLVPSARNELAGHIVPSTMLDKPMAPNVFLEVKGPHGSAAVATQQVRYDGAVGARGMYSLQNFRTEEPQYDGKPHSFSFTYHDGQLKEYAHHMTAPTTEGGRPEYHMTQVNGWQMTGNRDTCAQGIGAFRNTLNLAETSRGNFIQAANAKASQGPAVAGRRRSTTKMQPIEDSADELAPTPPCSVTQAQHEEESPDELAPSPLGYLYKGDNSQDPSGIDQSTSITTSFTSSFSTYQARSKRQRSPRSQIAEDHAPKTRSRGTRGAELSGSTQGSASTSASQPLRVRTYWRKDKLCFLNAQDEEVKTVTKDWAQQVLDDGSKYYYWQSPKSGRMFWTNTLAKEPRKRRGGN